MKFKRSWLGTVALGLGVAVLVSGLALRATGTNFATVVSGSMEPTIHAGDVVLTQPVPVTALAVGDVIAFYPPGESTPVIHRIASLVSENATVTVTTKGDANRVTDAWQARLSGDTAYRLVLVVPLVGWIAQYRNYLLIAAGLLLAIALVGDLRKEVRHRKRPVPA